MLTFYHYLVHHMECHIQIMAIEDNNVMAKNSKEMFNILNNYGLKNE